jgi:hypothetical protein
MKRFIIIPIDLKTANDFVVKHHRHHGKVQGHKFSIGLYDLKQDKMVAVAIVGRPVARNLDDGITLEVTRMCSDGTKNACSILYSRAWQVAQALGYCRIVTYILESENGASLKASNYTYTGDTPGRSWGVSRPRIDKHPLCDKKRYERVNQDYEIKKNIIHKLKVNKNQKVLF